MAFPWLHESTFEAGTTAEWDSETDTDSKLAIRQYRYLAQQLQYADSIPFRGAYAMHINLAGGTNDAYLQEDGNFDTALAGTIHVRLYCWVSSNITMAASDRFTVFTLQSAGNTDEATIGIVNNAGTLQWVFAETSATALGASTRQSGLITNAWHALEMTCVIDSGGGNDGTLAAYVDGRQVGSTITGLDQAAIAQARVGAMGIDAGTTAGHLLFDQIVADDGRIGPITTRFPLRMPLTKSGHVALGPGQARRVEILTGDPDNVITLYDTDEADVTDATNVIAGPYRLQTGNQSVIYDLFGSSDYFVRGLYVQMTGTNPRAWVTLAETQSLSVGGIRDIALAR